MFRHSLTLSLLVPLLVLMVLLMIAVAFDLRMQKTMPELRLVSAALIGLIAAWIPLSLYLRIRRRVLTPLRELRQKFMRAGRERLESMRLPPARDEISDVVSGYNEMAATLAEERDERMAIERERLLHSQLVALGIQADGMVHELASPLSTISTLAALAAGGDRDAANTLEKESRALSERLRRFMAHFKSRRVSVRRFDIVRLIRDRIDLIDSGPVRIRLETAVEPRAVMSDEILAAEIMDNLLKNAVRHARGAVAVEVAGSGEELTVTVSDDGRGIASMEADRLFRPFFTSSADGHGLGLFVSRLWAQALGGRLELSAAHHAERGGAAFRLTLPDTESRRG